ncbi:hypothetical protein [Paenibacillus sp. A14]|uniref:hypothetical protein n=1 Tax=Paenibacillus sp. A14 TaxID=3119820 RepID=UPI002FE2976C
MGRRKFWATYRNKLILAGILMAGVGGIYSLDNLFNLIYIQPRTIELPGSQFDNSLPLKPGDAFSIESATKLPNDFAVYNFEALNHNTLVLNRADSSYTGMKLSLLHLDDNRVKDIDSSVLYNTFSFWNSTLIYSRYRSNQTQETYAYDPVSGQKKRLLSDKAFLMNRVGDEMYIGFDGSTYRLFDLKTGKKEMLFTYEQLQEEIAKAAGIKAKDVYPISYISPGPDDHQAYMLVQLGEHSGIFRYSLKGNPDGTLLTKADEIVDFQVLKNGDLLVRGTVAHVQGLYRYHSRSGAYELLKQGPIWGVQIDEEQFRLAYLLGTDKQTNEVHVAYLQDTGLASDTVVYRNIDQFLKLSWKGDDLFVLGSSMDNSEIYRFTFRPW